MSSNIFLTIAIVTTGIFAVQFILSIFFGDIDADADIDTDISSVVSFKGLTHFGIGFGWYMYLQHNTEIQTYLMVSPSDSYLYLPFGSYIKRLTNYSRPHIRKEQNNW